MNSLLIRGSKSIFILKKRRYSMAEEKILIVDDERELAEIIRDYLQAEGYQTCLAFDGAEALKSYQSFKPQLIILDVMLPKLDGLEVCRIVRAESTIPILLLSVKKDDIDKILGLGLGADDYLTKPFSPGELVARVKAQLRRYLRFFAPVHSDERQFGDLTIDPKSYRVAIAGTEVTLAAKEFELLNYLSQHPSQVFTREQLFNQIWGFDEYGDMNTVTVHIRKIREKIETDPANPVYIKNVWGVVYKFDGSQG
jgi:DNA-binding response OmpR family regulator